MLFSRSSCLLRAPCQRACAQGRRRFAAEAAKAKDTAPPPDGATASLLNALPGAAVGLSLAAAAAAAYSYSLAELQVAELALLRERLKAHAAVADELRVELGGKTNAAFVFLKPHACKGAPGKVEAVVEESFRNNGIRILDSGEMLADAIDKNKHIDTHYGAIASKAVLLKPAELNVPDKGKAGFKAMFGESWDDAVAAGKVYNAADGAAKLGLDGAGLNAKWGQLTRGKDLIKFGGGFYCGKVDGIYVMNGFYMAMRAAYCAPGEKIRWYTVAWPSDGLSWADFRGTVLGATDPSAAPVGSIRRTILDQYRKLGLQSKPDTGDNGVHASASPFEALAERVNWLGVTAADDPFGKALLAAGATAGQIEEWSGDSQVEVEGETTGGQKTSVFDTLEDLDADAVLTKVKKIK